MKTEVLEIPLHKVALYCNIDDLWLIDSESRMIKAWSGNYIETFMYINNKNIKLITKLSGLGKTLFSSYYLLHPFYNEYDRGYLGDDILSKSSERLFTNNELLEHHRLNFKKLLDYEKRGHIV